MKNIRIPAGTVHLTPATDDDILVGMTPDPRGGISPTITVRDDVGTVVIHLSARQLLYVAATTRTLLTAQAEQLGRLAAEIEKRNTDD